MIEILIVEDDINKANSIISFFDELGINGPAITLTDNVSDSLSLLREKKFNIIILDLNIPLRNKSLAIANGGTKILYSLTSDSYMTPDYVIGLTQFEEYQKKHISDFNEFDFNIYNFYDDAWKEILTRKLEWIKKSSSTLVSRTINEKIIVCTHGIMTMGSWPKIIRNLFTPLGYKVITYDYPHHSALKILFPWSRKSILSHYSQFLQRMFDLHPDCELNFISHSYGTYLLLSSLEKINISYRPRINNIILCGSVLKSNYDLGLIIKKFEPIKIINDCAYNDRALLICNIFCFGLGNAGRVGFNGYNERVVNRFIEGDHSVFFEGDAIIKTWESLIVKNSFLEIDERNFNSIRENFESFINLLSPLLVPVVLLIVFFLIMK
ncbi:hypothetical protein [Pantoea ananatis]|uniref:hypothetical protein n=1 Tax=Pantoea ananas TaxID=553 RepID=UPI0023B1BC4E|nr:hypothetical protein [Pantoea ananatis]